MVPVTNMRYDPQVNTSDHCCVGTLVTRPERPKGAKDDVKRPESRGTFVLQDKRAPRFLVNI